MFETRTRIDKRSTFKNRKFSTLLGYRPVRKAILGPMQAATLPDGELTDGLAAAIPIAGGPSHISDHAQSMFGYVWKQSRPADYHVAACLHLGCAAYYQSVMRFASGLSGWAKAKVLAMVTPLKAPPPQQPSNPEPSAELSSALTVPGLSRRCASSDRISWFQISFESSAFLTLELSLVVQCNPSQKHPSQAFRYHRRAFAPIIGEMLKWANVGPVCSETANSGSGSELHRQQHHQNVLPRQAVPAAASGLCVPEEALLPPSHPLAQWLPRGLPSTVVRAHGGGQPHTLASAVLMLGQAASKSLNQIIQAQAQAAQSQRRSPGFPPVYPSLISTPRLQGPSGEILSSSQGPTSGYASGPQSLTHSVRLSLFSATSLIAFRLDCLLLACLYESNQRMDKEKNFAQLSYGGSWKALTVTAYDIREFSGTYIVPDWLLSLFCCCC